MEVPVVGHDENWGQDDHHEDQNIETKKHLVHTWAMTTFKSKKSIIKRYFLALCDEIFDHFLPFYKTYLT